MARKPADQSVHKEDIIVAAADVLRRNGYEAATMKDIAAAVNLTAASLYHHFKNKDMLLIAVLEAGLDYVISLMEPIVRSTMPSDQKLRAMIRTHVARVSDNTAVGAAMVFEIRALMNISTDPNNPDYHEFRERRDAFFARRDYFEDLFRRVIREGMESSTFRPIDTAIFVKTMLGAQNWVGVWYRPEGRLNGEQIAEMMADTFLLALKPEETP